jgi:molybdenum cofactor cytidylyltransferase
VLAAGASTRMGSPKALLPWADTTLLHYVVEQQLACGADPVIVVLGVAADDLRPQVPDHAAVQVVLNTAHTAGRSSSTRVGATAAPDTLTALVVQSVDQPCPAEVLELLFTALVRADADLAQPTFGGRRGHPVCFSGRLLSELRQVHEATLGLRAVVRRHAARLVEVPVPSDRVLLNLNDPAAYAAARRAAG